MCNCNVCAKYESLDDNLDVYPAPERKMFLPGDFNIEGKKVYIKEVLYHNPVTVVFWSDNTKTITKCVKGDVYSRETGLSICILKKIIGGAKVHDIFEAWVDYNKDYVNLKDVRQKCNK